MNDLKTFLSAVEQLDKQVKDYYQPFSSEDSFPIWDGLVDEEAYFNSKLKIMWILKEAYDKADYGAGNWSITKAMIERDNVLKFGGFISTWQPIIYTTYAILNGFALYDDIEFIEKDPAVIDVLKQIAFINVQKFPAGTTSDNREITAAYKRDSGILLKQIRVFNPDIIIGGNTMWNFVDDLGLNGKNRCDGGYDHWFENGKLYIDAAHPAKEKSEAGKEEYVDEIVGLVKKFFSK